jgi:hypothetical protein
MYTSFCIVKENTRINPSPYFLCDRMYVPWREREHEEMDVLVEEDHVVFTMIK